MSGKADARIFPVETRFQRMARRPGGVSREQAVESAETEIEQIKPTFDEWIERELQELIAAVEAAPDKSDWIADAGLRCRNLRDVGATVGFELLSFVADSLCELLDSIAAGGACHMESILCHTDALILSRQDAYRHVKPEQVPELTRGLRQVVKRASP